MTPRTRRRLRVAAPVVLVLSAAVFVLQGANRPADPSFRDPTAPATAYPSSRTPIPGFGEISFRVDETGVLFGGSGSVSAAKCALLAATATQRSQGLMGLTDLAGYDAMIFRFDADTQSPFFMKDTLIPLSIAWFDVDGGFVSATNMAPCGDAPVCPTYGPEASYRYALEVPQGELGPLGIGPGTRLLLGEERC